MSKKSVIIILCIILLTSVGSIFLLKSNNKKENQPTSDTSSYADFVSRTETENTMNKAPEKFSYTLKSEYKSRDEVLSEIESLKVYYLDYCVNKTAEEIDFADASYKSLSKTLNDWLYIFPPSDLEILTEKERMLEQSVFFKKENLTFDKNSFRKNPTSENYDKIKSSKDAYDNAAKVLKEYEKEKITIDETLEKLGVQNSRTLENYYKQIEAAKADSK